MTEPTQSVQIRRMMYASGTPSVLEPYFYDDSYDPSIDVLDPVLAYNPLIVISGYTFNGTMHVPDAD